MINVAGSPFDFGQVVFAVFEECEHKRRGLAEGDARQGLTRIAREKLSEIRKSYAECGGTAIYWDLLEREVLETNLPQYVDAALEQNDLERRAYGLWRQGDPAARVAFALLGLVAGGILIALPFVPIWEDFFAFLLALGGFLFPDLTKAYFDLRHARRLNRLIVRSSRYQHDQRIHYLAEADFDRMLEPATSGRDAPANVVAGPWTSTVPFAAGEAPPPPDSEQREREKGP